MKLMIGVMAFILMQLTYANRISFHHSLMDSVANGNKTATIRARHRDYYKLGAAKARSRDGREVAITIEKVELTYYLWQEDAITPEVLRRENLSDTSRQGFMWLFEALKRYYPTFKLGDPVTIIYFRVL